MRAIQKNIHSSFWEQIYNDLWNSYQDYLKDRKR